MFSTSALLIVIFLHMRTSYWFLIALFSFFTLLSWEPAAQPEWLQVMSDSEVEISSEQHWSCIAAGKPRPTIRWLRNGQSLTTQVTPRTHTHCCIHEPPENKYWSKCTLHFFYSAQLTWNSTCHGHHLNSQSRRKKI